jgi:hypothetical protein
MQISAMSLVGGRTDSYCHAHGVNDIRMTKICIAEPLVSELSAFEFRNFRDMDSSYRVVKIKHIKLH